MCTAIRFNKDFFGRTLDFERSFDEELIITPRESVRLLDSVNRYAIMGIGAVWEGHPLYFDGVNEWGLASAALNFPGYASYGSKGEGRAVESGRLISFILGFCRSVSEARDMLGSVEIIADEGAVPLHWIVCDGREAMVVESVADGLKLYDNPVGVLTNSPPFPYHLTRLADISHLTPTSPTSAGVGTRIYSRGMGAIGLPGDFSSSSRFLRASFIRERSPLSEDRSEAVNMAFDILSSLSVPRGCVITDDGEIAYTRYTAVIDMAEPGYYLTTASCRTVGRISLTEEMMTSDHIITRPMYLEPHYIDI